jgi:pSer/pThr/pTyr-binding forkhead associated (FHA) protein
MQQIVIRHLSGQRVNQVDRFPADLTEDLIAGRDQSASIHFDPQADDLVSRQHVKIVQDASNPGAFRLVDLQSRNGTFVNRRRIAGSTVLNHNDRVQLGASGPEFRFELDPPPQGYTNADWPAAAETQMTPQTREIFPSFGSAQELGISESRTIGRRTVEFMLDNTFGILKRESNKIMLVGIACLVAVILAGVATWSYIRRSAEEQRRAQQASQEQAQQAADQTRKEIEDASARIRDGFSQLEKQANQSAQKTQAAINSVSQKVAVIKRTQEREAAQRQLQAAGGPAGTAPVSATDTSANFGASLDRVDALVRQSKYTDALEVSRQMMRLDPNRYEGYFYGGVSALETQQAELARKYLIQAEAKAPAEKRPLIQPLLATAQQMSAREK